jgi:hypothetical protein
MMISLRVIWQFYSTVKDTYNGAEWTYGANNKLSYEQVHNEYHSCNGPQKL